MSQWSWAVLQSRPQKHVDKLDAPVVAACNASGYAQGLESGVPCVPIRQAEGLCKGENKTTHLYLSAESIWIYFPCTVSAQTKSDNIRMTARKHQLYHVVLHPCLSVAIKWLTRPNICSHVSEYAATSPHWCQGRIVEPKHVYLDSSMTGGQVWLCNKCNKRTCAMCASCTMHMQSRDNSLQKLSTAPSLFCLYYLYLPVPRTLGMNVM